MSTAGGLHEMLTDGEQLRGGHVDGLLTAAGLVVNRKQGRVVYYRLADGFPEPLREHCLRQLVVLSEAPAPDDG